MTIYRKAREICSVAKDRPIHAPLPSNIMIELTNACNLRCKMCYQQSMKRKRGMMEKVLFERVIEEAKRAGIKSAGLYTVGESFIHPHLFEFISYAKKAGLEYVYLTTNGILLTEEKAELLLDAGLDSIKFSIDAASREAYEKIRVGARWDLLLDNMRRLRRLRDRRQNHLGIYASFLIMRDNLKDLYKYQEVFRDLVDETLFGIVTNQGGHIDETELLPEPADQKIAAMLQFGQEDRTCSMLWNRMVVTYDGRLVACCFDFDADLEYGNVKDSLATCWNNESMLRFRKKHLAGDLQDIPLCRKCDAMTRNWETVHAFVTETLFREGEKGAGRTP